MAFQFNSVYKPFVFCFLVLLPYLGFSQVVAVGNGSYTLNFPGTDAAGRNAFPSGVPYTTSTAASQPVPTNDWWSAKVKNAHTDNLFNYPFTMKTKNSGLVVTYIPRGVIDNIEPVIIGVSGLNASAANVSDFSDWTVSMDWQNGTHHFNATSGIGMPFIYFTKDSLDLAKVTVNQGTVTILNEKLIISNARNGADFAVYAPLGSTWQQNGSDYTSTLNGKNYWSMAFIPLTASNVTAKANAYQKYAYVFPTDTRVDWQYNANTAELTSNYSVFTDVKEGNDTTVLMGLLPHQWANLNASSPNLSGDIYRTVRGDLKMVDGNQFSTSNTFYGILPTLPYLDFYSPSFDPIELENKISALQNDQLNPWTDSYNEGQMMNRLIQTARIAEMTGDTIAVNTIVNTVRNRLEDWLEYQSGELAFLFYYNQNWTTLIGYPAGHGQDANINDHHFHWGYFIHAASFVEQFQPGWANQWGSMINLLIRDAASDDRNDNLFPFLRNFSPYAGHCWANGFASFPQGNDQESTSESMQFNSSLIHWGSITNNTAIRDLGIYLYTTEQSAIEEYWFDQNNRNFSPSQQYSLVSRVWGNSYDNGTFFTADIAASYGIELYPIHGGSLYLGHDTSYVSTLWAEMENNTGILSNQVNPHLWHDIYWEYLAFIDPDKAIQLYDSYPNRTLKFGVSDAQTYHWLHAMKALGIVDTSVTANTPLAAVFSNNGNKTYVAHNYNSTPTAVLFSDGFTLNVPAHSTATSRDIDIKGLISTDFTEAYPGSNIPLRVNITGGLASAVEFYAGDSLLGQDSSAPFEMTVNQLTAGRHHYYARVYQGNDFNITNLLTVSVGEQLPYSGNPIVIPGIIEPGNYDIFQGGSAFGISYLDNDPINHGGFRPNESVDAAAHPIEGNTVGWIAPGEWLEYTIDVQQSGFYNLSFRYASNNSNGGGPFHLLLDEDTIRTIAAMPSTGGWNNWNNRNISFIPLKSGINVLRIAIEHGEFNLGKMNFTFSAPLPYSQPIADAGVNQLIQLPLDSAVLNASGSVDPNGGILNYHWEQVYGPSIISFNNDTTVQTTVKGLIEGIYLIRLTASNNVASDRDLVYLISSNSSNVIPSVSIQSPLDQSSFLEADTVNITALASDLDGTIDYVDFFVNNTFIGTDSIAPFENKWVATIGNHLLTAIVTDNGGSNASSAPISIQVNPAPSCRDTSSNGEFLYEFSTASNNPTITFIPTLTGMGNPTCLLYYSTTATGPFPGFPVTPNVPFQINASQGSTIYFYYTYSYPGQGQHNNSSNPDSYKVGTCKNIITSLEEQQLNLQVRYYPNPVTDVLTIEMPEENTSIEVYDAKGSLIDQLETNEEFLNYDMRSFKKGMYLFRVIGQKSSLYFKVIYH